MPRAIVLNTASKNSLTGGSFADPLTANSGDSLAVANYNTGAARILEMWAIDTASVAELSIVYTRPESTHDQQRGLRLAVPALVPGGAGNVAAHMLLGGLVTADLYKSDVGTFTASGTAADGFQVSYVTEYDDLPGVSASFISWTQCQALQKSIVGITNAAAGSATKGSYGSTRAINADDDRFHGNTWYAILGFTVRTQVTTVSLLGPDWGGQRIGGPAGTPQADSSSWFVDQAIKWNKPLIPVFNSNNKANTFVQVADAAGATTPNVDIVMYELNGTPNFNA